MISTDLNIERPTLTSPQWQVFCASIFLVSIPVFFQAPLVRVAPEVSLLATLGWLILSFWLWFQAKHRLWGDLLFGFTLSWLAGTLYWGWLRTEPLLHIPVEAIPLPIALFALFFGYFRTGSLFFIGSFLGTCLTDLYCMGAGLMPWWSEMMAVENNDALLSKVLRGAMIQVTAPTSMAIAAGISLLLLSMTAWAIRKRELHWWAFGGAVFSTLLVDALFIATMSLLG